MFQEQAIQAIFRKVFKDDSFIIKEDLTPNDIFGWQSLTHMELINAIEKNFNLRFTLKEVMSINTIGDIASLIENKLSK